MNDTRFDIWTSDKIHQKRSLGYSVSLVEEPAAAYVVLDMIAKKKLRGITLRYGHGLFRIRKLDLKAHQKMIADGKEYTPCYLRR